MATKAIVGEKVGMTQVWGDDNRVVPVTVVKVAPARDRAGQDHRARRLQRPAGHLRPQEARKLTKPRGRPLRARRASSRAPASSSCASTTSAAIEVGQEIKVDLLAAGELSTSPPSARARASPAS